MRTIDQQITHAPPDTVFGVAADVENWPRILPHYRWVRFLENDDSNGGIVEMAAWRPFGPVKYPTWWKSEMRTDPVARTIHYVHVEGVTTGMRVEWRVTPHQNQGAHLQIVHEWDGPGWPFVSAFAADRVIGPHFVSHIAGRTLSGVAAEAERMAVS